MNATPTEAVAGVDGVRDASARANTGRTGVTELSVFTAPSVRAPARRVS
jgi:hypothetical protein